MSGIHKIEDKVRVGVLGLISLSVLYLFSRYNYLLFHSIAESFSILIACGIFIIAWNSRRIAADNYLLFIGIAYLFIAFIDFLHTITYKGMGIFHGYDTNLPTQLWIGARYLESISLMAAPFVIGLRIRHYQVFAVFSIVTAFLVASIFYWQIFPVCFVEGAGLTPFKKFSEYIISLILVGSIFALKLKRNNFETSVYRLLIASIILTISAEMAFTFYVDAYGFSNLIGHYFKIISYYFIYRAIIQTGLTKPINILFGDLRNHREHLMEMVEERTAELQTAMQNLEKEASERKLAQEEAIRSAKLASLGELAAGVAHEINNPINGIINYSQILMNKAARGSEEHDIAGRIIKESDRIAGIVGSLLSFARHGDGEKRAVTIDDILSDVFSLMDIQFKKDGIAVKLRMPRETPLVYVQPQQVEQVFLNIISNARYALNKKYPEPDKDKVLEVSGEVTNIEGHTYMSILFFDNGCGIPQKNINNVLNAFFTTKPAGEGTGLGLSISQGIIHDHKGNITIDSVEGEFTKVVITLPTNSHKQVTSTLSNR